VAEAPLLQEEGPEDGSLDLDLLAEFFEAVDEAVPPSQAALEEAVLTLERLRPSIRRCVRRRAALVAFDAERAAHPQLPIRDSVARAAKLARVPAETLRCWVRTRLNPPAEGETVKP
jgi:hypothetical protein